MRHQTFTRLRNRRSYVGLSLGAGRFWKKEDLRPYEWKNNGSDLFPTNYLIVYGISLVRTSLATHDCFPAPWLTSSVNPVDLVVGATSEQPIIRLYGIPASSFILLLGGEPLLTCTLQAFHQANPNTFMISSQEKGASIRSGNYMSSRTS